MSIKKRHFHGILKHTCKKKILNERFFKCHNYQFSYFLMIFRWFLIGCISCFGSGSKSLTSSYGSVSGSGSCKKFRILPDPNSDPDRSGSCKKFRILPDPNSDPDPQHCSWHRWHQEEVRRVPAVSWHCRYQEEVAPFCCLDSICRAFCWEGCELKICFFNLQ
jgi:hypothetical protein